MEEDDPKYPLSIAARTRSARIGRAAARSFVEWAIALEDPAHPWRAQDGPDTPTISARFVVEAAADYLEETMRRSLPASDSASAETAPNEHSDRNGLNDP